MLGSELVTEVRQRLRDVETTTSLGTFYNDATILMFLNHAQIQFIEIATKYDKKHLLSQLVTTQSVSTGTPPFTLASNYLSPIGAAIRKSITPALYYACEIKIGGNAYYYWDANIDLCFIINTSLYFKNGRSKTITGEPDAYGHLYYYRQPIPIVNGQFTEDFNTTGRRIIVDLASLYLAIKDIKGQREIKNINAIRDDISLNPAKFAHYIRDYAELITA